MNFYQVYKWFYFGFLLAIIVYLVIKSTITVLDWYREYQNLPPKTRVLLRELLTPTFKKYLKKGIIENKWLIIITLLLLVSLIVMNIFILL